MRFRLVLGIAALPLALPACFSSSAGDDISYSGEDSGVDAGSTADATMTGPTEAAAAAPDAPVEAQAEASVVEAGPSFVTVVIMSDLGPEPGVSIVFQDGITSAMTTVLTDANGRATQVVGAGSQVTAVLGTSENIELVTIEGVMPGDVLTAHDATASPFANAAVSIDALPDAAAPPGTDTYVANIGNCTSGGFNSVPVQINLSPDCANGGTFPVLLQALNSDDSAPLGYSYQIGNTLPLDGGVAHVSLSGAWSTASPTQAVGVTNASTTDELSGFTTYSEIANGVAYGPPSYFSPDGDGGAINTFPVHPGYPAHVQNEASQSGFRNGGVAVSAVATRTAPSDGGAASFDLSTLLPLLDNVTLDSSQPAQPIVSWVTEAGSLATANGTIVALAWSQADDAAGISGTWIIVAPPTVTSVQAPQLPGVLAARAPSANANFSTPPTVIVVSGSFLQDYGQLRALFSSLPPTTSLLYDDFSEGAVVPPLPVDGTLRLTAFTANGD
jgi:hypothetical protein